MWAARPISMVGRRFPCFSCDSLTSSRPVWISCRQSRPSIFLAAWLRALIGTVLAELTEWDSAKWTSQLFGFPPVKLTFEHFWCPRPMIVKMPSAPCFILVVSRASFRSLDERKGPLTWHVVNEFAVTRRNFELQHTTSALPRDWSSAPIRTETVLNRTPVEFSSSI